MLPRRRWPGAEGSGPDELAVELASIGRSALPEVVGQDRHHRTRRPHPRAGGATGPATGHLLRPQRPANVGERRREPEPHHQHQPDQPRSAKCRMASWGLIPLLRNDSSTNSAPKLARTGATSRSCSVSISRFCSAANSTVDAELAAPGFSLPRQPLGAGLHGLGVAVLRGHLRTVTVSIFDTAEERYQRLLIWRPSACRGWAPWPDDQAHSCSSCWNCDRSRRFRLRCQCRDVWSDSTGSR